MAKKKKRPQGHYCKICGQYKANEKFSGKGHAAHICKVCSRLSAAEKSEAVAVNRLMELPFRHLSESDKKWLENRIHDKRLEVADMAREVYRECFPHTERNAMKKQLVISMLDFEIHTEVYQEYGDWENVDQRFHIMRKERAITFLDAGSGRPEQKVKLDGGKMSKLLRWAVHTLEIFMWPQDYCLVSADGDPFMELMPEIQTDDIFDLDDISGESSLKEWENFEEMEDAGSEGEVSWRIRIEYSNGLEQDMTCYDGQLTDKPEELYFRLLEYFEPEEDGQVLC